MTVNFRINQHSGSRLVGAMTKLGDFGPKHHGLVIGEGMHDGKTYVAESGEHGYQCVTVDEFGDRYKSNGKIEYYPNNGNLSGHEIAKRAVDEINKGGKRKYNVLFNNCESFVNRAVHGSPVSCQSVGVVLLIVGVCVVLYKGVARAA